MPRPAFGGVPLVLALLLVAMPASAYVVVLKDGTQIATKEKYRVEGDKAILLLPTGLEASYAASEIDYEKTLEANGKPSFLAHACNECHGVAVAGIRAKTHVNGAADLGGYADGGRFAGVSAAEGAGRIAGWLMSTHSDSGNRAQAPPSFEGTEDELQAVLDWLGSLEVQE